jgi:hypothetical protein
MINVFLFYIIEPEVSGGLGPNTVVDTSVFPPRVSKLEYMFDDCLGDSIIESFPYFFITEDASKDLIKHDVTGFKLAPASISMSPTFHELNANIDLPSFKWLKVHGVEGQDDFWIHKDNRLIVSHRALDILITHQLDHANIEPLI